MTTASAPTPSDGVASVTTAPCGNGLSAARRRLDARRRERPPPVSIAVPATGAGEAVVALEDAAAPDDVATAFALYDACGTHSIAFTERLVASLERALSSGTDRAVKAKELAAGIAVLQGLAPRDEIEAMLGAQMVGTHAAAMRALQRLGSTDLLSHAAHAAATATRMLRTYAVQMQALKAYRATAEQRIVVERVNVAPGGQAIVGAVSAGAGVGGVQKSGEQPHEPGR